MNPRPLGYEPRRHCSTQADTQGYTSAFSQVMPLARGRGAGSHAEMIYAVKPG